MLKPQTISGYSGINHKSDCRIFPISSCEPGETSTSTHGCHLASTPRVSGFTSTRGCHLASTPQVSGFTNTFQFHFQWPHTIQESNQSQFTEKLRIWEPRIWDVEGSVQMWSGHTRQGWRQDIILGCSNLYITLFHLVLGMKPGASCMLEKCSTMEIHLRPDLMLEFMLIVYQTRWAWQRWASEARTDTHC